MNRTKIIDSQPFFIRLEIPEYKDAKKEQKELDKLIEWNTMLMVLQRAFPGPEISIHPFNPHQNEDPN